MSWRLPVGVVLERLGDEWAVFSPLSGETHLLNDTGALLLQLLAESGPLDSAALMHRAAEGTGQPLDEVSSLCLPALQQYASAGLVVKSLDAGSALQSAG